jgi:hypothetical protein
MMLSPYNEQVEEQMRAVYARLSEKDRRLYAAVEALKLPYGGISYIARLFACSRDTIRRGIKELGMEEVLPPGRDRKAGGGRKSALKSIVRIDEVFLQILQEHTAGDPMDEKVKCTNLSVKEIGKRLKEKGIEVSRNIVRKLLKKHDYRKRKALKKKATGQCKNRDAQFGRIAELRKEYEEAGNPVVSVDTKKKEALGNLYREGALYTQETIEVYDHDFPSLAEGVAIPHTIYDVVQNSAYVNIGTSKDTSEFACDSIRRWWNWRGRYDYPEASSILMLMDGGSSNSSRQYLFKQDLQTLADTIGIEIRVAHYPPYTSKWNPVEHRVFPHITRSLQGVVLKDHQTVKELVKKTTTETGLKVKATIIDKVYETGRTVIKGFKESMRIVFDEYLGQWNYVASPENG